MGAVERFILRTSDPATAEKALGSWSSGVRLTVPSEGFEFSMRTLTMLHAAYSEHGLIGPGVGRLERPDPILVVRLVGSFQLEHAGESLSDLALLYAPRPVEVRWDRVRSSGFALDRAYVDRVASGLTGRLHGGLVFTSGRPVDSIRKQAWARTSSFISASMAGEPDALEAPLLRESLVRHLTMTLLHTFPNRALADLPRIDVRKAVPTTVRRAMAFIDEHAHEPITVEDVAAAVHLTTRGLQVAFRRALDTTPSSRLRQARMDGVHRDLARETAGTATVAAIARRWGFAHVGNFAAAYRRIYGVLPSITLNADPT